MIEQWTAVDDYMEGKLIPPDPVLAAVLQANADAGLPAIDVSPLQGKMLQLFARMVGARRILEVGTLGGYSTIWMARALPVDGRLVSLEVNLHHAEVARANITRAGLDDRVEIRVGPAIESLPKLATEDYGPFDMVFIDADKPSNADYLAWALKMSRPGTLIVCDNVVRGGRVVDANSPDASVQGSRRGIDLFASDARLTATTIQTVGSKGWDGFTMGIVGE